MPAHLHVVSINPNISKEDSNNIELKLVVGGETSEQARDLVRKMEASKRFRGTHIDSEATRDEREAGGQNNDRVKFDISALYVPSSETEDAGGVN